MRISLVILFLLLGHNFLFAQELKRVESQKIAAGFNLSDLENNKFSLSDLKNKPVVLIFWTTWCPYCRKELKLLNSMHEEISKSGIQLFAVNAGETSEKVKKFLEASPFSFVVLLDEDTKVSESYGILGVPTYIFINKDGYVVFEDHFFPQKEYKDIILR